MLKLIKYRRYPTSREGFMGLTFSTILNESWTDFLQFFKDAGYHTLPNVRPRITTH